MHLWMRHFVRQAALCGLVAGCPALFAQTLATGDTHLVVPPHLPLPCRSIAAGFTTAQRSAPPEADDTARMQAALTACAGTGRSVVLAASQTGSAFFTGTLAVNGEALVVLPGVTLYGNSTYSNELLQVSGKGPAILGTGTIDGRGDLISGTPRLIQATDTTDFVVAGVTLEHAGKEHLYVEGGSDFLAFDITIATPANTKNTDGIDLDSITNAFVIGSSIEDGDDGVAIKTNSGPAANITVFDNKFYGTHGMSIGSQTMYGVTNVLWDGNQMYGTDMFGNVSSDNNGINIKSDYDCGGVVKRVTYRNTQLVGIKHLLVFNTSYGSCTGTPGIPVYQDIGVDGVTATGSQAGAYSEFEGYSASNPLELYLAHVHLDVTKQEDSQDASVGLEDSDITPSGMGVTTFAFNLRPGLIAFF